MSSIFRLDASIRQEGSVTRAVADTLQSTIVEELDGPSIVRRDVALDPVPGDVWATAVFAGFTAEEDRTVEQTAAVGAAKALADEVVDADVLVFASRCTTSASRSTSRPGWTS